MRNPLKVEKIEKDEKVSNFLHFSNQRRIYFMNVRSAKRKLCIQQWQEIIRDRNNSGLTIDEYCNQNGISRNAYFYWLRLIREEALKPQQETSGFVELSLPAENNNEIPAVTVIPVPEQENSQLILSVNGVTIQVTDNTSSALLARTIEVIKYAK